MNAGELSQEDIDALLGGGEAEPTEELPPPAEGKKGNVDVPLKVRIELGRRKLTVEEILALGEGSVVELDKLAGEPVDILVNDRVVARGELLVMDDNFCVRVTEILKPGRGG